MFLTPFPLSHSSNLSVRFSAFQSSLFSHPSLSAEVLCECPLNDLPYTRNILQHIWHVVVAPQRTIFGVSELRETGFRYPYLWNHREGREGGGFKCLCPELKVGEGGRVPLSITLKSDDGESKKRVKFKFFKHHSPFYSIQNGIALICQKQPNKRQSIKRSDSRSTLWHTSRHIPDSEPAMNGAGSCHLIKVTFFEMFSFVYLLEWGAQKSSLVIITAHSRQTLPHTCRQALFCLC